MGKHDSRLPAGVKMGCLTRPQHQPKETAMPAGTRSAVAMLTDFFAADDIEATARRTGFVQRTSKMTGKLFLALVTFGTWSEAQDDLGPTGGEGHPIAPARGGLARSHASTHEQESHCLSAGHAPTGPRQTPIPRPPSCDDGLFAAFHKVYIADSTGFALPDALHKTFPGAGGSAAKAGAKIQAVWDYKSSLFDHFALTPWNIPRPTVCRHGRGLGSKRDIIPL